MNRRPEVSASNRFTVVRRYALFQLPELALAAFVLAGVTQIGWISASLGWGLLAAWILKEIVLFPFVRRAYEPSDPSATSGLVGARVTVTAELPAAGSIGYVRMGGELWRARLASGASPAPVGVELQVRSVEGVTLIVETETTVSVSSASASTPTAASTAVPTEASEQS